MYLVCLLRSFLSALQLVFFLREALITHTHNMHNWRIVEGLTSEVIELVGLNLLRPFMSSGLLLAKQFPLVSVILHCYTNRKERKFNWYQSILPLSVGLNTLEDNPKVTTQRQRNHMKGPGVLSGIPLYSHWPNGLDWGIKSKESCRGGEFTLRILVVYCQFQPQTKYYSRLSHRSRMSEEGEATSSPHRDGGSSRRRSFSSSSS